MITVGFKEREREGIVVGSKEGLIDLDGVAVGPSEGIPDNDGYEDSNEDGLDDGILEEEGGTDGILVGKFTISTSTSLSSTTT